MRKKIFFGLSGLIILIALGAIFFFPKKIEHGMKNPPSTTIITKQDDGKEIQITAGGTFEIQLEELGSAGYTWQVDEINSDYIQLVSSDTKPTSDLIGAPVLGTWKFKALKNGQTEIKMDYFRPWEGKESAVDHFSIKILIK